METLARYFQDGTLNTSFGNTRGIVRIDVFESVDDVAIQQDGKIIAVRSAQNGLAILRRVP